VLEPIAPFTDNMRMKAAAVCLIDNSLKDFTGHHFEYVRSIATEFRNREIEVHVLAHSKALPDFDRFFPTERVFRRSHYDWPCGLRKIGFFVNLWILNRSFYADLNKALHSKAKTDWLLFAPNVNHQELFAWAYWLRRLPQVAHPQVRLFMRWSYYQEEIPAESARITFVAKAALRLLERFPSVRLVTDSTRLADEYARLTRLPIDVLPIPHTAVQTSAAASTGTPTAVFLGGARSEKGFDVLVEAARQLRNDPIRLIVQCPLDDPADGAAAAARAELDGLEGNTVRLIREQLDSNQYYQLLDAADIVVIPYREKNYRARTSGILVEALAAGKPVVVTKGTWMADQVLPSVVGLTFDDGNAGDLRRAILELASSLDEYRRRACKHREQWLNFHNPSRLAEMLLA
jgi:glycosyltransferase involved in cell wall biosynthesis